MKQNLKKYFDIFISSQAASELFEEAKALDDSALIELALPNLVSYVRWVLNDAVTKKLETLYFYTEEGYLLKEIADIIVKRFELPIVCRYLYCSSLSLCIPSFRLLDDEKYRIISRSSPGVSPAVILGRVLLSEKEREQVYNDICFDMENEHTHFSNSGRKRFAVRLRASKLFRALVMEKSAHAYENAVEYLKQEGMTDKNRFALVSLGLGGGLQRTLTRLLESSGYKGKLRGYYFGLYDLTPDLKNDGYQTYYFSPYTKPFSKLRFNSFILRALCAAPHMQVIGYAQKMGEYSPIFSKTETDAQAQYQRLSSVHEGILTMTDKLLEQVSLKKSKEKRTLKFLRRYNKNLMFNPTAEQAAAFEGLCYYNGISEANKTPLARKFTQEEIKGYRLFERLKFRKRSKSDENLRPCVFWSYGSLAFSDEVTHKRFYRNSLFLWELLRLVVRR